MRNFPPVLLIAAVILLFAGCSEEDPVVHSDPPVIVDRDLWYVNASASGAKNGSSWTDAFTSVQEALDYASEGDEIWVAGGTYVSPEPGDSTVPVVMMKPYVDLYGGFSTTDTEFSQRDPDANRTILDGENMVRHVVIGSDNAKLDGFVIQSGYAFGDFPDNCGGGMLNFHVSPQVDNCIFTSNDARFHGGGMANIQSSTSVRNTIFRINATGNNGAGVYNDNQYGINDYLLFENCVFGPGNSCRFGGGMYNNWSEVSVTDCLFTDNLANHNGGGLYNTSSRVTAGRCVFRENRAVSGGAVYLNGIAGDDVSRLENCLIETNTAYANGGGIYFYRSTSSLINCTIVNNGAIYGGGISCWLSEAEILNCIVWENVASLAWQSIEIGSDVMPDIEHCDIDQDGYGLEGSGSADPDGNIRLDPLFVAGPLGDWYLSCIAAGQGTDSPCAGAGTRTVISSWLSDLTTRTDGAPDTGAADIGFHYSP